MGLAIRDEEEVNDRPKVQKQHPNKIQTTIDTKKNTHAQLKPQFKNTYKLFHVNYLYRKIFNVY